MYIYICFNNYQHFNCAYSGTVIFASVNLCCHGTVLCASIKDNRARNVSYVDIHVRRSSTKSSSTQYLVKLLIKMAGWLDVEAVRLIAL